LWRFARWYREQLDALVIGVTGSVGKTTTREMIHAALKGGFRGTQSPQNFNNHFGLPLSIFGIDGHDEFAVLEMGASHVGEIRNLAEIAVPEVGVVTAIGLAHVEGFGSEDNIVEAKGELLQALPSSGFAVLAGDDKRVRRIADRAACRVILVGEDRDNDLRATNVHSNRGQIVFHAGGMRYTVPAVGRHHLTSALCAVAIGREVGMTPSAIAEGLETFVAAPGRCQLEEIGPWTVVNDAYNANPSSMQAAFSLLREWRAGGKKIVVAGDMLELGDRTIQCHRELGKAAARLGIDHFLVHGRQAVHVVRGALDAGMESHRLAECESLESLLAVLECWLEPGDVVLVKGSRALRMERVVEWMRGQCGIAVEHKLKGYSSRENSRAVA
jgi:UDP-N-acetylmuramoyl-tripeptide--D-alanyl-D-alanine ligase